VAWTAKTTPTRYVICRRLHADCGYRTAASARLLCNLPGRRTGAQRRPLKFTTTPARRKLKGTSGACIRRWALNLGSTFARTQAATAFRHRPEAPARSVADNSLFALSVEAALSCAAYQILGGTPCPNAAIAVAKAVSPDFALVDVRLETDPDGVHVAKELRRRFNIPSIFLTAVASREVMASAREAEPLGWISKPADLVALPTLIEASRQ
jgi:CheY-like chemotaxis protein